MMPSLPSATNPMPSAGERRAISHRRVESAPVPLDVAVIALPVWVTAGRAPVNDFSEPHQRLIQSHIESTLAFAA